MYWQRLFFRPALFPGHPVLPFWNCKANGILPKRAWYGSPTFRMRGAARHERFAPETLPMGCDE
ncbi:hypothetical protein D3C87_1714140 [compost metagenome]